MDRSLLEQPLVSARSTIRAACSPEQVDQSWLLPLSAQELVPPGHPAHLVREIVRTQLDLSAIFASYEEERG
jgi:hypothetical protein